MLKFKVLGFSLILIYSFFLNTINCSSSILPGGEIPALSQIRQIEHDSRDEILPTEVSGEGYVFIHSADTIPPGYPSSLPLQASRKEKKRYLRDWSPCYRRGVALEKNRVLRI